ncbi:hypothetical protein FQ192_16470 [Pseudomonas sp. ANT_J12]|uniref:hypothetical protein n=1 Tax=Pseudomonas sp. ANT_J12 TaxID=2597351 RepID=UPI0011F34F55|nr:hypothetical protein [Pseudomonas sp. ANT_J12]KAA0988634.1 hypothetical protein FQ192_16470 [Pseudomonas sp. ANT_J12]
MNNRLIRLPLRDHLCETNDAAAIKHIKGTVVVWWYLYQRKNNDAQSVPYVDVVFRYLDNNDVPAGFTVQKIGISRLGTFRIGTIWSDGTCIHEAYFGKEMEFAVDFTWGSWSYMAVHGVPTASHDFPQVIERNDLFGDTQVENVATQVLSFPLPGDKNLLISCTEFLVRCYGRTSEMPRILATYPWPDVLTLLFADTQRDANAWVVSPSRKVHDDDALFLASILYDPYAATVAKSIYSQLDNARALGHEAVCVEAMPWFQGPAKIAVRGRWINRGTTFLCLEVTGMSQPQENPYEISRPKYTREDPEAGEVDIMPTKPAIEFPRELDPFEVTDLQEPDLNAATWNKPDPGFRIIGEHCPFKHSPKERSFSERRTVPTLPNSAGVYSTGDPQGSGKDVAKITFNAKRYVGNGGILNDVWEELKRVAAAYKGISDLAWYHEKAGFNTHDQFKLLPLASFSAEELETLSTDESNSDKTRRWLAYPTNANRMRGILVLRIVIDARSFYLFEIQRKKIRKKASVAEEQISGLLMQIDDPSEAMRVIDVVCDKIRLTRGRFSKLKMPHGHSYCVFKHFWGKDTFAAGTTLRTAFKRFLVQIEREPKPSTTGPSQASGAIS